MICQDLRSEGFVEDSCQHWRCHSEVGSPVSEWSTSTASLCRPYGWSMVWSLTGSLLCCFHPQCPRRSERSWLHQKEDSGNQCRSWWTVYHRSPQFWCAVEVSRTSAWLKQVGYRVNPDPCGSSKWTWFQLGGRSLGRLVWLSTTSSGRTEATSELAREVSSIPRRDCVWSNRRSFWTRECLSLKIGTCILLNLVGLHFWCIYLLMAWCRTRRILWSADQSLCIRC